MIRILAALMLVLLTACSTQPREPVMEVAPPPPPMMASPPPPTAIAGITRRMVMLTPTLSRPTPVRAARPARGSSATPNSAQPAPPGEGPADDGVEQGKVAFNVPPPMEVGHSYQIEFVAGPTDELIRAETEGRALTQARDVLVGRKMRVVLLPSSSFTIKPLSDAEQLTGLDKTATWQWEVTPKDADATELKARINVFRQLPDGSFAEVDGYNRTVPVKIQVGKMKRTLAAIDDASTLGSKLTGLFGTWQKTIGALVALLGALGLLAWKLGLRRFKPAE